MLSRTVLRNVPLMMRGIILPILLVIALCHGVLGANMHIEPGTSALSEGLQRASNVFRKLFLPKPPTEQRSIKLFVASLPRTGTTSLEAALESLGYNAMHGAEYIDHAQAVLDVDEGRKSVDDLMQHLEQSGFDVAGMDLMHHYWRWAVDKDVKVILTVRDVDKWATSIQTLSGLIDILSMPPFVWFPKLRQTRNLVHDVIRVNITGGDLDGHKNPEVMKAGYRRHVEQVTSTIPPSQLLIWDVKEGWEPLCRFLGHPVPAVPFPHVNDAAALKVALGAVRWMTILWPLVAILALFPVFFCYGPLLARRKSSFKSA